MGRTFHEPSTEVGARAVLDGLHKSIGSLLVGLVHLGEVKTQLHLGVIGHKGETITLLYCVGIRVVHVSIDNKNGRIQAFQRGNRIQNHSCCAHRFRTIQWLAII